MALIDLGIDENDIPSLERLQERMTWITNMVGGLVSELINC